MEEEIFGNEKKRKKKKRHRCCLGPGRAIPIVGLAKDGKVRWASPQ